MKLKALTRLSLRKSPDPEAAGWDEWHVWEEGDVFEPPKHMKVELAIQRGIAEKVTAKKKAADG